VADLSKMGEKKIVLGMLLGASELEVDREVYCQIVLTTHWSNKPLFLVVEY
jgi:hypothetical protein